MATWQTDPQLQHLIAMWANVPQTSATVTDPTSGQQTYGRTIRDRAGSDVYNYIDQHRTELGIPDGYYVSPQGQLIKTSRPWWVIPAVGGAMALGGLGISAALGSGAADAAAAGGAGASGASAVADGAAAGTSAGVGGYHYGLGTSVAQPTVPSLGGTIADALTRNVGPLAGMLTSLAGTAGGGSSANDAQLARLQAITEARMRRVDPLHQMVTQLAASRLPISVQQPIPNVPLPE